MSRRSVGQTLAPVKLPRLVGTPITLLSLLALGGCMSRKPVLDASNGATSADRVTCDTLARRARWMPWLSEPGSRLVLNPTPGNQAPNLLPVDAPGMPVNLGYFVGEHPFTFRGFWDWSVARPAGAAAIEPVNLFSEPAAWHADAADLSWQPDQADVTIARGPVSFIERSVTADLGRTPWMLVDVPALAPGLVWAAKVNDGRGGPDIFLQRDTSKPGRYAYDLTAATGWRGERTFNVRLFAVGKTEAARPTVSFAHARLVAGGNVDALASDGVEWEPHRVTARANGGGVNAEAAIAFPDSDRVAQCLTITSGTGTLLLSGDASPGHVVDWRPDRGELEIIGDSFRAILTTSRPARLVGTWRDRRSFIESVSAADQAGQRADGCWSLAFDDVKAGDRIVVTARFAAMGDPVAATRLHPNDFDAIVDQRAEEWSSRLTRVPRPATFSLTAVDPHGVNAAQLRQSYYKAWAFLFSTILPPMPENGYPFPQIACGKASTWDEGHPRASASAQWESMIGIQLISLVEPEIAWRAYEGLMSLVDADGTMGGEGLPSRHAQTAWILYRRTHDADRLRKIYAPMKRMLLWKISDPRWIYKSQTPAGQKDAEFVVHALLDIEYARRIAVALEWPEEERFWAQQSTALAANYRQWFWDKPGAVPYRIYETSTGTRSDRGGSWTLQGLALPPEVLGVQERDSLLALLRRLRQSERPFLVPGLTKHATYLLAARGMMHYGRADEAREMLEAAARDVVRAGEFAETYEQGASSRPSGVTPSIFGAAMLIDALLLRNGIDVTGEKDYRAETTSQRFVGETVGRMFKAALVPSEKP